MINRRAFVAAAALGTIARPAIAQSSRAGVLKLAPTAGLTALDPIWTTAVVTTSHGYAVFDTLYALDRDLRPRPQMADGHEVSSDGRVWRIRLRSGLRFHNGEPVRAIDCAASLERWSKRDSFGQLLARSVEKWAADDDRTIRIDLSRPFPALLDAIAKPASNVAFMMPEHLARTPATTAITEMIGSGPYRFNAKEFVAGSSATYTKFEGYASRQEQPSFLSGGKVAQFERVEWNFIPDASTAAAALASGEIDWVENPLSDLVPVLKSNAKVRLEDLDPWGMISIMRFNAAIKPFNDVRLRKAVLEAVDQSDFMQSINGSDIRWQRCAAMFPCGLPGVAEVGDKLMNQAKGVERLKSALGSAGYNGERVVILNPSDQPAIGPLGQVTADVLGRAGMNVDLQTMDWGTVVQRRTSTQPVEAGGWSIFHTWTPGVTITNPAVNYYIRGQGKLGWFGWFDSPQIEALTGDWLASTDPSQQQAILQKLQVEAFEQVPIVPLGQYYPVTALRSDLASRIPCSSTLLWSIRRA